MEKNRYFSYRLHKNTLNNIDEGLMEVSLSDEKECALHELRKYLFEKYIMENIENRKRKS